MQNIADRCPTIPHPQLSSASRRSDVQRRACSRMQPPEDREDYSAVVVFFCADNDGAGISQFLIILMDTPERTSPRASPPPSPGVESCMLFVVIYAHCTAVFRSGTACRSFVFVDQPSVHVCACQRDSCGAKPLDR